MGSIYIYIAGWWFGTFFIFHNIWDNPSHWRSYFSRWLKPPTSEDMGMGQYLLIQFLVGWTSIFQLFWGSLGTRVWTHPHMGKVMDKLCFWFWIWIGLILLFFFEKNMRDFTFFMFWDWYKKSLFFRQFHMGSFFMCFLILWDISWWIYQVIKPWCGTVNPISHHGYHGICDQPKKMDYIKDHLFSWMTYNQLI